MMTVKLQIVVGLAILFILAILINMIRRRSLELKCAVEKGLLSLETVNIRDFSENTIWSLILENSWIRWQISCWYVLP